MTARQLQRPLARVQAMVARRVCQIAKGPALAHMGQRDGSLRATQRLDRDGTRRAQPNDSIEIRLAVALRVRRRAWRACPRRAGSLRDTQRLDRDGTRGAIPSESIEISRPRRAWAGDDRASAQAHFLWKGRESGVANASRSPTIKLVVTRANA